MGEQIPLNSSLRADDPARDSGRNDGTIEVTPDIAYRRLAGLDKPLQRNDQLARECHHRDARTLPFAIATRSLNPAVSLLVG
ncbi:MAG: hypothetical protein QOD74_977 [Variibacter sp.]|nr:hypothetical protein [Variibacter sp.]